MIVKVDGRQLQDVFVFHYLIILDELKFNAAERETQKETRMRKIEGTRKK